jgi:hypothetical protein
MWGSRDVSLIATRSICPMLISTSTQQQKEVHAQ